MASQHLCKASAWHVACFFGCVLFDFLALKVFSLLPFPFFLTKDRPLDGLLKCSDLNHAAWPATWRVSGDSCSIDIEHESYVRDVGTECTHEGLQASTSTHQTPPFLCGCTFHALVLLRIFVGCWIFGSSIFGSTQAIKTILHSISRVPYLLIL